VRQPLHVVIVMHQCFPYLFTMGSGVSLILKHSSDILYRKIIQDWKGVFNWLFLKCLISEIAYFMVSSFLSIYAPRFAFLSQK
jgi:hypothetical protein